MYEFYSSRRMPNCATRSSPWRARCPTCRESTTVRTTRTPRGSPVWRTAWRRSSGNSRSSRTPSCPWSWRSAATGSFWSPRRTGKGWHGASRGTPRDAWNKGAYIWTYIRIKSWYYSRLFYTTLLRIDTIASIKLVYLNKFLVFCL